MFASSAGISSIGLLQNHFFVSTSSSSGTSSMEQILPFQLWSMAVQNFCHKASISFSISAWVV
jgi:hypothetical protein